LALKKKRYDLNRIFAKYNLENTIILLEGKRNVIESIKNLSIWSSWQQTYLKANGNMMVRFYFSQGVLQVAPERLQVITPTTTVKLIMRMKPFHSTRLIC
jgi:hypothetical protein